LPRSGPSSIPLRSGRAQPGLEKGKKKTPREKEKKGEKPRENRITRYVYKSGPGAQRPIRESQKGRKKETPPPPPRRPPLLSIQGRRAREGGGGNLKRERGGKEEEDLSGKRLLFLTLLTECEEKRGHKREKEGEKKFNDDPRPFLVTYYSTPTAGTSTPRKRG